jgi:hypothetical protein
VFARIQARSGSASLSTISCNVALPSRPIPSVRYAASTLVRWTLP